MVNRGYRFGLRVGGWCVFAADANKWLPSVEFTLKRCACSYAFDSERNRLCLFGGFDGASVLGGDVFFLDVTGGASCGFCADENLLFPAHAVRRCVCARTCVFSVCEADPIDWPWHAASPELTVAPRFGGAAIFANGSLMLFGGVNGQEKEGIHFLQLMLRKTRSVERSVGGTGTATVTPAAPGESEDTATASEASTAPAGGAGGAGAGAGAGGAGGAGGSA